MKSVHRLHDDLSVHQFPTLLPSPSLDSPYSANSTMTAFILPCEQGGLNLPH